MAPDTVAAVPRDIAGTGKKKRVNRSAKLKQCKLDARREQWLNQVKSKDAKGGNVAGSRDHPQVLSLTRGRSEKRESSGRRVVEVEREESLGHDSTDSDSLIMSPTSGSECASRKGRRAANDKGSSSGSSSGSSRSSIVSSSWTVSDAELEDEEGGEDGGENGVLDDWEAVADALDNDPGSQIVEPKPEVAREHAPLKLEPIRPPPRAWKPDDAARPVSLPSLSKHRCFMASVEQQHLLSDSCRVFSSPTSCPICCEDLDVTDSSFLPCHCGFRLCLFCYNRILEEDGRCPGCRKKYSLLAGREINVGDGGTISDKLPRSLSMSS